MRCPVKQAGLAPMNAYGENGKHNGFRFRRPQGLVSSNLTMRTIENQGGESHGKD